MTHPDTPFKPPFTRAGVLILDAGQHNVCMCLTYEDAENLLRCLNAPTADPAKGAREAAITLREEFINAAEVTILRHLPSAAPELTEQDLADIAALDRWREQLPANWYQQPLLARLSKLIARLRGQPK